MCRRSASQFSDNSVDQLGLGSGLARWSVPVFRMRLRTLKKQKFEPREGTHDKVRRSPYLLGGVIFVSLMCPVGLMLERTRARYLGGQLWKRRLSYNL